MKKTWLILLVMLAACSSHDDQIAVAVSGNNTIRIHGLPVKALEQLARDTSKTMWLSLLPVYRLPADEDLKDDQPEQPGKYMINKADVYFTPDTTFVKRQPYFVRYYQFADGGSLWDIVRKKNRPGEHPHVDVPFKL